MIHFTKTFMRRHSAFIFPLVIIGIATKMSIQFTRFSWQGILADLQTMIAGVVVLWVLARYLMFLFGSAK